jgi:hypothetical protein
MSRSRVPCACCRIAANSPLRSGDTRIAHHDISLFMSGLGIEFAAAIECSHRALPPPCFAANLRAALICEFPSSALEIGVTRAAASRAARGKPPGALAPRPERNLL